MSADGRVTNFPQLPQTFTTGDRFDLTIQTMEARGRCVVAAPPGPAFVRLVIALVLSVSGTAFACRCADAMISFPTRRATNVPTNVVIRARRGAVFHTNEPFASFVGLINARSRSSSAMERPT